MHSINIASHAPPKLFIYFIFHELCPLFRESYFCSFSSRVHLGMDYKKTSNLSLIIIIEYQYAYIL